MRGIKMTHYPVIPTKRSARRDLFSVIPSGVEGSLFSDLSTPRLMRGIKMTRGFAFVTPV